MEKIPKMRVNVIIFTDNGILSGTLKSDFDELMQKHCKNVFAFALVH